ncbi:uncharacterized protein (DUF2147 family) [Rhodoblastus acidophilus]|uniref:DUF2147 domain-containing protein n=1 Tax=Rhodoblastus acidophilus TaxID=1074 RepID=UPI002224FC15|nr:DUF2147 domain-containing protein [Rhodoblastus acidophilus]MCW2283558.1 uncharacterized protein (DUF2147 family) [Rhodoblastus acidophilus]MCW2332418.1 uncharacterized protein (DUF2147 family) [Rhodoblastus acidophilus]
MKKLSAACAFLALFSIMHTPVSAEERTVKGFWQSYDDSDKPNAWFYFTEKDGVYEGRLVKGFPKPGEEGKVKTCDKCEGPLKGLPVVGLPIVTGMKRDGLAYEEGKVLDPRDGTVYDARMDLSPDGKKLELRGYVGISVLGQTKTWTRLPDNAMPLDALPHSPVAGKKPTP